MMNVLKRIGLLILAVLFLTSGAVYAQADAASESYYQGVDYVIGGEFGKAEEAFIKAQELAPNLEASTIALRILEDMKAQTIKEEAVIYVFKGILAVKNSQYEEAINDFTKAIEINPEVVETRINRGIIFHMTGQNDQAMIDFNEAIEIDPESADAYSNRGIVYHGKDQYEQALADYSKSIELNPELVGAYYNRAAAYHEKDQYARALSDYDKVLELDPENLGAYNNRGILYFVSLDEKEKGCADFRTACEKGDCTNYNRAKERDDCQ